MNGERMENSEDESEEMYDWDEEEQDEEENGKSSQDLSSTSEPVSQVGAKNTSVVLISHHILQCCEMPGSQFLQAVDSARFNSMHYISLLIEACVTL